MFGNGIFDVENNLNVNADESEGIFFTMNETSPIVVLPRVLGVNTGSTICAVKVFEVLRCCSSWRL